VNTNFLGCIFRKLLFRQNISNDIWPPSDSQSSYISK